MSRNAEKTRIGRATLCKYFPDAETILLAWHERQIARHLRRARRGPGSRRTPAPSLEADLEAYALIQHQHLRHGTDPAALRPGCGPCPRP